MLVVGAGAAVSASVADQVSSLCPLRMIWTGPGECGDHHAEGCKDRLQTD